MRVEAGMHVNVVRSTLLVCLSIAGTPDPAHAQAPDGAVLIDQTVAMAGGVTPDDTAGFPVTITRSGRYRVSGNLKVDSPDTSAVYIAADNVTLDLNGFVIEGPGDRCRRQIRPTWCSQIKDVAGVYVRGTGVSVINGTIHAMSGWGLFFERSSILVAARLEGLTVSENLRDGIVIDAPTALIEGSYHGGDALVVGNRVIGNGGYGVLCRAGIVMGNLIRNNVREGLAGTAVAYGQNLLKSNNHGAAQTDLRAESLQTHANWCNGSPCPD